MVRDLIYSLAAFLLLVAVLAAVFWSLKTTRWTRIEAEDGSMAPDYPPGLYRLKPAADRAGDLEVGKAYAYYAPGDPQRLRAAWLVATAGQRLEISEKGILVDGRPTGVKINLSSRPFPAIVIPRGCVYLVATTPQADSVRFGPIPARNVRASF
jgi:type IV secretory pathway protease TraF